MSYFLIVAESRSNADIIQFLVDAPSHREAWRIARDACHTGVGALVRVSPQRVESLGLTPSEYTVKRVRSETPAGRGRPPKLTTYDLNAAAHRRGVRIPRKIQRLMAQLEAA